MRKGYDEFEFRKITKALMDFMVVELSAFYFDIRKDALYCDAPSSAKRKACIEVVRHLFNCLTKWTAPLLPFTTEEAWLSLHPDAKSVHLEQFPEVPASWRNDALAKKWDKVKDVRRAVTGALELERAAKRIGSSLEAAPLVHVTDADLREAIKGIDMAEISITSDLTILDSAAPSGAFASGRCQRRRRGLFGHGNRRQMRPLMALYTHDVGSDPDFPDVSARDAAALKELKALGRI